VLGKAVTHEFSSQALDLGILPTPATVESFLLLAAKDAAAKSI
jgi:hypothetical protein